MPHRRAYRYVRSLYRSPHFWPVVQVLATVVAVLAVGYIVYLTTVEQAAREARVDADNRAAVQDCFDRNAQGPAAQRFFDTLETILTNQLTGSTISSQRPDFTAEQRAKYRHIVVTARASLNDLESFRQLNEGNTPTRRDCRRLAEKLGVRLP